MPQTGTVIMGGWFYDRMEPAQYGFIDGAGWIFDLEHAILSGVASRDEKSPLVGRRVDLTQFGVGVS